MFKCCVCNKKAKKEGANDEIPINDNQSKTNKVIDGKTIKVIGENGSRPKLNSTSDSEKQNICDKLEKSEMNQSIDGKNDVRLIKDQNTGDDTENENQNGKDNIGDSLQKNKQIEAFTPLEQSPTKLSSPQKNFLYSNIAYIERTVDDGPEEEGDDSVFEAGPPSIETNLTKKSLPGVAPLTRWLSQEETDNISEGCGGMQEPPATPVARDELALRRHRFFSDLLEAAQNTSVHRVRFDPLGPTVHAG